MKGEDYFSFFGIKPAFFTDESALKKSYYLNSRKYHPDHSRLDEDNTVMDMAEYNNRAYKTLADFHTRMEYILREIAGIDLTGIRLEGAFLMEMMEINEKIGDLRTEEDRQELDEIRELTAARMSEMLEDITPLLEAYDRDEGRAKPDHAIAEYFLKRKYLLRIQESLDNFAAPESRYDL